MMKPIYILVLLTGFLSHAQQSTVAAGGNATGSGGTVSFSVGQISYKSPDGALVTDGVQQPYEINTLGTDTLPGLQLRAYPNPVSDQLQLTASDPKMAVASVLLTDLSGKQLFADTKVTSDRPSIDFKNYPSGVYLLQVQTRGQQQKTFKIIKK